MSIKQQRISLGLVILILLVLSSLAWLPLSGSGPGHSGTTAHAADETLSQPTDDPGAPLDPWLWSRTQALRRELRLTAPDLAAMGATQATAEGVLVTLRDAVSAQQPALESADAAVRQAEADLKATYKRIHIGPRDEAVLGQLPTRQAEFDHAKEQRRQLHETIATSVRSRLSSEQASIWETARGNEGVPQTWRYAPGVSESQVKALKKARDYEASQRVMSGLQQINQTQAMARHAASIDGVLAAEARVLPVPAEMLEEMGQLPEGDGQTAPADGVEVMP